MVHWVRLGAPSAGGLGSIAGQGTISRMPQRRLHVPQQRPGAAKMKTWCTPLLGIHPLPFATAFLVTDNLNYLLVFLDHVSPVPFFSTNTLVLHQISNF